MAPTLVMNGAEALLRTLVDSGVEVCFANPGTSEMHFVAALDRVPGMRAVLGLFEGVVTGAADGYGRMAGKPAATLLHLGPGLGNGFANLHNARRARTPIVNVIGDHATYHQRFDAPLQSDIESVTSALEGWTRRCDSTTDVAYDGAAAVAAAYGPPGRLANLILPADVSWTEGAEPAPPRPTGRLRAVGSDAVSSVVGALRSGRSGERPVLLLGGDALREPGLVAAGRVAAATGAAQFAEVFPARMQRGAGVPFVARLAYFAEMAQAQLAGARHLVLAGALAPVSFFGYPGKASVLTPSGCQVHVLAEPGDDVVSALARVADELGADADAPRQPASRVARPAGALTPETFAAAVAAVLPEGAIISDEGATSGGFLERYLAGAPRHDVLTLTGGAIGQGVPLAVGAAVACPDRPVLAVQADGGAMYTISALWTMARESLNTTVVILDNGAYAILRMELQRVGADAQSPAAGNLLDLTRPRIDFVALGNGMGVPSTLVTTAEELTVQLERSFAEPGPHLIHALLPRMT